MLWCWSSLLLILLCVFLQEELSSEEKETALPVLPSLLEVTGHTYFFGGFLVGPQVRYTSHRAPWWPFWFLTQSRNLKSALSCFSPRVLAS